MGEAQARELDEYAQTLISEAVEYLDENGRDSAVERYNDPASVDGAWYVFIMEERNGALYAEATPTRPDLAGTTGEFVDANGFDYGEAFTRITEDGGGAWVSYLFTHPLTGDDAPKRSWVVRRGDLLVGTGWYE